ncbi:hypothetical protein RhiJN_08213 [Ceratobasidium sp. AG-Ba]|nr:hypothetical protein RhiJN_08213 [Ceratobasidium sp. AG-Ba]QRW08996.1 hypothetical protein RhiLY_07995 [Ceratobasidium sp. AG-Ba]
MLYDCVDGCDRTGANAFHSRKSRTMHQITCQHVRALNAALDEQLSTHKPSLPPSKRRRIDNTVSEPGVSESAEQIVSIDTSDLLSTPLPVISSASQTTNLPIPPLTRSRARRLNTAFREHHDALPEAPAPLPPPEPVQSALPFAPHARRRRQPFATEPDVFGRYRVYNALPLTIPDATSLDNNPATQIPQHTPPANTRSIKDIIAPCPNISAFYIQRHHWLGGNQKSLDDRDSLCNNVILQPDFNRNDIIGVNFRALDDQLAEAAKTWDPGCPPSEGWQTRVLNVQIPPPPKNALSSDPVFYEVPGFRARSLIDQMRRHFSHNKPNHFHYEPYEAYWIPPDASPGATPIELRDEVYSSPAMMRYHREIQGLKIADSTCKLPRCVAAYMLSSDGLQFGNFCHTKGWPIFGMFGNVSKYERAKPLSNTVFEVGHIPVLPDSIIEAITKLHGKPPTDALLTHLRRELMQEVWKSLLDDEFIDAYFNGVEIKCADGITRRVFPRILTYSADYPEKVLVAAIRNGGDRLCPRCLVKKSSASLVGTPHDTRLRVAKRRVGNRRYQDKIGKARHFIYQLGRSVQGQDVERLLKGESYVPTLNAFTQRLGNEFNIYSALVVDQLHEVELGVWKSVFKHLVRLVHLNGNTSVVELDKRFRAVPTFGSSIRLFAQDVSSMSRMAARDFEDILQCCYAVFEGLLPPICEEPARTLIFLFASWHGLAKLRLHTKVTLKIFKGLTKKLGLALRNFATLTEGLDVRETPEEYARRKKQYESTKATSTTKKNGKKTKTAPGKTADSGRRQCRLNLNTYKVHALGDYYLIIAEYGTTDSYSTQIGELHNRRVKAQYERTNRRNEVEQMTRIGDICMVLEDIDDALEHFFKPETSPSVDADGLKSLLSGDSYFIGQTDRSEDMIPSITLWADRQRGDDATKLFVLQLKRHLLARFLGTHNHPDFNDQNLGQIHIQKDRMYRHRTLRVNYTTYDVHRDQDVLNPSTSHSVVLLPAELEPGSNDHPFIYAKILGVYHAKVGYGNNLPRRMDFIHVRWLYYDYERPGGWETNRLDRLSYIKCDNSQDITDSFDFIDPKDIIRAAHLIPEFAAGTTTGFLQAATSISHDNSDQTDWNGFYVNRFVDRDMLMRYIGGGVGHFRQKAGQAAASAEESEDEGENAGEFEGEEAEAGDEDEVYVDDGVGEGEGGENEGLQDLDDEFEGAGSDSDQSVISFNENDE